MRPPRRIPSKSWSLRTVAHFSPIFAKVIKLKIGPFSMQEVSTGRNGYANPKYDSETEGIVQYIGMARQAA
jgi:hypothetical protein